MQIGVDCHASCTMSSCKECFEDLKLKEMGQVGGISNGLQVKGVGTFKFHLTDDQGTTHQIKIPNSLYVPGLKRTLLSPKHWVQQVRDNVPCPNETGANLDGTKVVLFWNQKNIQPLWDTIRPPTLPPSGPLQDTSIIKPSAPASKSCMLPSLHENMYCNGRHHASVNIRGRRRTNLWQMKTC